MTFRSPNPVTIAAALSASIFAMALPAPFATGAEKPKDIIAAQLRRQGVACDKPKDATPDAGASKANKRVWTLACANARYRVTLAPKMRAEVEALDDVQD